MSTQEFETVFAQLGRRFDLPLDLLRTIVEIRESLDAVERLLAARARGDAATWSEIGAALGISRQAPYSRRGHPSSARAGAVPVRPVDGRVSFVDIATPFER